MRRLLATFLIVVLSGVAMTREVNAAAMAIANAAEGCILQVYRDPAGIPTAGYGHVVHDLPVGSLITQEQADAWRSEDMARAAAFVEAHVKVPTNDNQFGALAEFTYNVGVGNFLGSTLLKRLNDSDYDAVPAEILRWTKAGGKVLPGLVSRRAHEAALFRLPVAVSVSQAVSSTSFCPSTAKPVEKPTAPSLWERLKAWLAERKVSA